METKVCVDGRGVATFIGIDLHKESLTYCVLNQNGEELAASKIATKCRDKIVDFIKQWQRPLSVAIESVGFYRWFWLLLEPLCDELILADATRLHAMADRNVKTDFKDAKLIAKSLFRGDIPTSFALKEPLYSLRQRLRHRHDLARRAASLKNCLRRICLRTNLPGPKLIAGDTAVSYFKRDGDNFHPIDKDRWNDLTDQLILLEREIAKAYSELKTQIESIVSINEDIKRLCTAPGVDVLTATTVLTETGGLQRFNNPKQLASYAGLTPRTFQSANTLHHGHISKAGPPTLRWVLQQAAWCAMRTNPYVKKIFNRITRKTGKKQAATAIARKLLIWLWAMHKNKSNWSDVPHIPESPPCLKCPNLNQKLEMTIHCQGRKLGKCA